MKVSPTFLFCILCKRTSEHDQKMPQSQTTDHIYGIRYVATLGGPPGVLGIWGEWLFIFRDLGSTGNYFRGSGEQAQSFGDLGSPVKKQKNTGKASILFDFLNFLLLLGGKPPLSILNVVLFV